MHVADNLSQERLKIVWRSFPWTSGLSDVMNNTERLLRESALPWKHTKQEKTETGGGRGSLAVSWMKAQFIGTMLKNLSYQFI